MLTAEQHTFLFTRWISSWPGGHMSISYLLILAWKEWWGILRSFLLSWIPYNMLKYHSFFNYFCNSINYHSGQWNCNVNTLKVFYSSVSFSNFIGKQNVLTVTYWTCLQDTERPLDHLFCFSSTLFSIWKKKKRERKTVWHFFMLPLIFHVVTTLTMV